MKIALATTTINVPTVLALYRKYGPNVAFFVAGDVKTPDLQLTDYCQTYLTPESQKALEWKCSELIGWSTIRRRNIAVLEALKWGADIIIVVDDDNICIEPTYFYEMEHALSELFNGCNVFSSTGWFDPGNLLIPKTKHRGFPHEKLSKDFIVDPVCDRRVGVAAGLVLGDPDIDACTRLEHGPIIHAASELGRACVVVDPKKTWTVYNTQNTAYLRELAPAMFCAPGLGRHDDIFASLITQRIMRELGYVVHLGQPFVWQQRNPHNLLKDLNEEVFGMTHIVEFADWLNSINVTSASVIENVRSIYIRVSQRPQTSWWPMIASEAALAWCDDCEKAMA